MRRNWRVYFKRIPWWTNRSAWCVPLAKALNALGWTRAELARRIHASNTEVGRWMHGIEVPTARFVEKIQRVLARGGYFLDVLETWPSRCGAAVERKIVGESRLVWCSEEQRRYRVRVPSYPVELVPLEETSETIRAAREKREVYDRVISNELKERLAAVVSTLTEREEAVLRMRFVDGLTLDETGARLPAEFNACEHGAVTKERVRQIEAKALRKLRHPSRIRRLEGFLEFSD